MELWIIRSFYITKRLKKVLFMVLLIVASQIVCDAQSLYNRSNMLVGRIEANGVVRDSNNMMIGRFESDGDVRNKNNMLVGKIETNGTVRDKNNMMIGRFEQDGDVRDKNNMKIGKVETDGTVRDRNNLTIGYAKGVPIAYAAVFFFFNMFDR